MAKRFTDTGKWKKDFIKSLPVKMKLLWFYILDDCDHAGIWEVDLDVASLRIGETITYEEAFAALGSKIRVISKMKWFVEDFIFFQYGDLKETNNMHRSVIAVLKKYNIDLNKPLSSPSQGAKDKEKEKDKVKDKEKVQDADSDFQDYEQWTRSILSGDDWIFNDKVRNLSIPIGDRIEEFATSHLALLAKYPRMKPPDQNRFRISLIGHINDKLQDRQVNKSVVKKVKFEDV